LFVVQHLLCLLLQALACVAMNPSFHTALNEAEVADMLMQLLLPSDEWYYTNHSTKYAKFVKYHAARILVYMGLFHKLGGRVDLFDRRRKYLPQVKSINKSQQFIYTFTEYIYSLIII
jgi:phosphatidylinositol phospholipase C epsilon